VSCITISIANNEDHAEELGLVSSETHPCVCTYALGTPDALCACCDGTGEVTLELYPYEYNLSAGAFSTLWHSLGFAYRDSGTIDPRTLLQRIRSTPAELLTKPAREEVVYSEGDPHTMRFAAVTVARAEQYLEELTDIAEEAEKREDPVVWW